MQSSRKLDICALENEKLVTPGEPKKNRPEALNLTTSQSSHHHSVPGNKSLIQCEKMGRSCKGLIHTNTDSYKGTQLLKPTIIGISPEWRFIVAPRIQQCQKCTEIQGGSQLSSDSCVVVFGRSGMFKRRGESNKRVYLKVKCHKNKFSMRCNNFKVNWGGPCNFRRWHIPHSAHPSSRFPWWQLEPEWRSISLFSCSESGLN